MPIGVCTGIQVLWAAPEGLSSADLSGSPIGYLHWLCLLPVLFLSGLALIFNKYKVIPALQIAGILILISGYWLFINYDEFIIRQASWSTFSTKESWYYAIEFSSIPIPVCAIALGFALHYIFVKTRMEEKLVLLN